MPIPPTPVPQYPNVPQAPGVPPLVRQPGAAAAGIELLVADAADLFGLFPQPVWGIFDQDGNPVIAADTVLGVEYSQDNAIATAPQEQGAFLSYNKVSRPFHARVTFAQGDTSAERNAFLQQILDAQASLDLYDLVTPDIIYPNVNVVHHDYRRTQQAGTTLLAVDVWVEEVRVTGTTQFSSTNVKQPSAANPSSQGTVQGVPALSPSDNPNISAPGGAPPQTVPPAGGLT